MSYKVNDLVYFDSTFHKGVGKIVTITGGFHLVRSKQIKHKYNGIVLNNDWQWYFEHELKPFTKKVGQKYKVLRDKDGNFEIADIVTLTNLCEYSVSYYAIEDECGPWLLYDIDHDNCEVEFYEDAEEHKENEMFTKDDLKVGYLVKTRDGEIAHIVNTQKEVLCLNYENAFSAINIYNNDLTNKEFSGFDIVEVYGYVKIGYNAHKFKVYDRKLLWKREEVKEMTIEDIQNALGHKVKVVE